MIKGTILVCLIGMNLVGQGRGGGIPGATEQQTAALGRMTANLAAQTEAVAAARTALTNAAFRELCCDIRRTRVEAVFQQLLEDRRRPFDDFARGDLADQQLGQDPNVAHGGSI